MHKIIISLLILGVSSTLLLFGCKKADEGEVTIIGSTTVLPVMQKIAEIYMDENPDADLTVSGGGSGVGITALLDGTADIAMASRLMKDEEWELAKEKGLELKEVEIAKDGIAIVLHPSNGIDELTLKQVHDIYAGEITNWKDSGGADMEIVVVSRDTASGTFEIFNKVVLQKDPLRDDSLMQTSNATVRSAVAGAEGGIGYIGIGYITDEVKSIKVDGVEATEEMVISGDYPIARSLFLYLEETAPEHVQEVINFVLSKQGQKIVGEAGYIPLK